MTASDQGDGTTKIAINGTLRNTGGEWLRFLAQHTDTSGYYATSAEPNAALRFESSGVADYFDTGLGPGESMALTDTIAIPHARLQGVSVTISFHVAAGHAEPGSTRYGWARSETYSIDDP
ncbi:hypothetical protein Rcae01_00065 [Novipirellula caenicola]|uniref:Uncharacterized protein n=1 Tax=Novipirellula caenicola TaxID=1536901 RepID=A0ABP9VIM3_9BACT